VLKFFELFGEASEYDRDMLYANLEKWWNASPNYKRRRLVNFLLEVSKNTPYDKFQKKRNSITLTLSKDEDDVPQIELHPM
jgi:hypothetical protein